MANKELTELVDIKKLQHLFEIRAEQILSALPKHLTVEKVARAVSTEITKNPELKTCSLESIYYATIQCAQLGLIPNSLTAEAYLVPRNSGKNNCKECNFQAGYLGLLKLAYQHPLVQSVDVKEIREQDRIEIIEGTETKLIHQRPPLTRERGKIIGYYAVAHLRNGASRFEVMSLADIHEHKKKYCQGWEKAWSAWQKSEEAMCKKTVLRKLFKYLPSSVENWQLAEAVAIDERHEMGLSTNFSNDIVEGDFSKAVEIEKALPKTEKLATKLYEKYYKKTVAPEPAKKPAAKSQPKTENQPDTELDESAKDFVKAFDAAEVAEANEIMDDENATN